MKQIIVPTDFSKGAWNALLYAADLGEALGIRELIILNSYQAPHAGATTLGSIDRIMQKDSEVGLDRWMEKIKEAGISIRFNFHMKSVHSGLVEAIIAQIDDYNDTLIVMGSLGETGMVEKIFGSSASDVALKAKCPVIIVPPEARYSNRMNVVLGSDYDQVDSRNLRILRAINSLDSNTSIQIVHVLEKGEALSGEASMGLDQKDVPHSTKEISGDDVTRALDEYVSISHTDLLVLIKKETNFFDTFFHHSITRKLTLLGHVPLLILKRVD
jgi:nucleotide-binding universal stress UspA family protein